MLNQRMRALHGFVPLATCLGDLVLGFEKGGVVNPKDTQINGNTFNLLRFRDQLCPGTVLATDAEKVVVSTQNPEFVVELEMPVIVPKGRCVPTFKPGFRFHSITPKTIWNLPDERKRSSSIIGSR